MTLQRRWREWLNAHVLDHWLTSGRYYQLNLVPGDHTNPEYRVAEDLRLSVEAPVEFAIGVFSAVISAITFIGVLWFIGGELTIPVGSTMLHIPGFLVVAAVHLCRAGQRIDGHDRPRLRRRSRRIRIRRRRSTGTCSRASAKTARASRCSAGAMRSAPASTAAFTTVRQRWCELMMQYIRTTVVSQSSSGLAPIIPILLCAPKYVAGTMTLGEVMQAASAFMIVQVAFNWLVENYPRLADWTASASPIRLAAGVAGPPGACRTGGNDRPNCSQGKPRLGRSGCGTSR